MNSNDYGDSVELVGGDPSPSKEMLRDAEKVKKAVLAEFKFILERYRHLKNPARKYVLAEVLDFLEGGGIEDDFLNCRVALKGGNGC